MEHYISKARGQAVLYVGDLSYADYYPFNDQRRWDTWGRFVERSNAYQPWIWAAGNHEIDYIPEVVSTFFLPKFYIYKRMYKYVTPSGEWEF